MILSLFGGVFLLLYGVNVAGKGLQGWAGPRIKTALETMTRNRFAAVGTGVIITFLLQSSSATAVTVVSLIDSGLMSFFQALGVLLGAGIGTTITVQLIAFKIYDYALFICGVGLLIRFIVSDVQRRRLGEAIFGFGLIFLSIGLMSDAMEPLQASELFREILRAVGRNPFLGVIVALALTAVVQSSAAVIGIAIIFSLNNLITIEAAIPIILGANIGTAATGIISSVRSSAEAKRAAFANAIFKTIGVVIVLPLVGPFAELARLTSSDVTRQIANAHSIFNFGLAIVLLPFINKIGHRIVNWFPDDECDLDEFKPKYLNQAMLSTPSLALAQATRETMRMAEIVQDMLKLSYPAILNCDTALIEKVENMDDRVDILDKAVRFYLTQLSKEDLDQEDAKRQMEILIMISNLEAIGDVVDKNLMELARKKAKECVQFSKEGEQDIEDLHSRIIENFELTMSAATTRDKALADRVYRNKNRIRDLEKEYYRKHIERLESGLAESFETSSIHLDVLTNLKRTNTHLTNIVYPLLETSS